MKPHISSILKKGATLKVKKLNPNDPKIKELIEYTCKEQEKLIATHKLDYDLLNTYITI
jgi:hypothetical protein